VNFVTFPLSPAAARRWVAALALSTAAAAAQAQLRTIPQDAARGTMSAASGMSVILDGNTAPLAPGAVIRNQNNLIIVPSALPASSDVRYTRDGSGRISQVWVLTDAEKRSAPSRPGGLPFFSR